MLGNCWEWTLDTYDPEFYTTNEATKPNPVCLDDTYGKKIIRGGSFLSSPICLMPTYREWEAPTQGRFDTIGFRLVCRNKKHTIWQDYSTMIAGV